MPASAVDDQWLHKSLPPAVAGWPIPVVPAAHRRRVLCKGGPAVGTVHLHPNEVSELDSVLEFFAGWLNVLGEADRLQLPLSDDGVVYLSCAVGRCRDRLREAKILP